MSTSQFFLPADGWVDLHMGYWFRGLSVTIVEGSLVMLMGGQAFVLQTSSRCFLEQTLVYTGIALLVLDLLIS